MSADAIVKSFIDRILRLKEEQDALAADIREVYAEVKGRGFTATLTDDQKAEALAYRGDDTHGEITEQEQPETDLGVSDPQSAGKQTPCGSEDAAPSSDTSAAIHSEVGENVSTSTAARNDAGKLGVTAGETAPKCETCGGRGEIGGFVNAESGYQTDPCPACTPSAAPAVEPEADTPSPPPASGEVSEADVPAFLKRDYVLRPHCLHPDSCGGYSTKHCHACLKARDDAILGEVAA